jgi:protein-S-isoprenylcysteine O-methyltransferase Ste14
MIFRDKHEPSVFPKILIATAMFASVLISYQLVFFNKSDLMTSLQAYKIYGQSWRNNLLLFSFALYFLRLIFTLTVFYRRKLHWLEAIVIVNIMPFIFPYLIYVSGRVNTPVGWVEASGVGIYLVGSFLNSFSELTRFLWKRKKENQGRIYCEGLFRYAMHINYTGDVLIFTGMAMIAHSFHLMIIPALMLLNFVFILIPLKSRYLRTKYKNEYLEYAARTKKLIPGVY